MMLDHYPRLGEPRLATVSAVVDILIPTPRRIPCGVERDCSHTFLLSFVASWTFFLPLRNPSYLLMSSLFFWIGSGILELMTFGNGTFDNFLFLLSR
jgi:hypothetical protein